MKTDSGDDLKIEWCRDPRCGELLARFFVDNVDVAYIATGEITDGRATDLDTWKDEIEPIMRATFARAIPGPGQNLGDHRVATVTRTGRPIALALVKLSARSTPAWAMLEDILVDAELRGSGTGSRLLAWVETRCREEGVSILLLESGIRNIAAHRFFERSGFGVCSKAMIKSL